MLTFVKNWTKKGLLAGGRYARRLADDRFPGVAVLCYHGLRRESRRPGSMAWDGLHVRANEFEGHCRLIRETCHPISLDQWRAARRGEASLPPRPVLVTFDDGYRSLLTVGRPILEKFEIPACVFVCTGPAERGRLLWYDACFRRHGESEVERLKRVAFNEWRRHCRDAEMAVGPDDPNAVLTPDEVRALARMPGWEVGAHTVDHPILANLPLAEQHTQIAECQKTLQAWIGLPVRSFAYPNGRPGLDYTAETVELLEELGFDFAFTTEAGFATDCRPFEVARFFMLSGISAAELGHRLCYSWRRPS